MQGVLAASSTTDSVTTSKCGLFALAVFCNIITDSFCDCPPFILLWPFIFLLEWVGCFRHHPPVNVVSLPSYQQCLLTASLRVSVGYYFNNPCLFCNITPITSLRHYLVSIFVIIISRRSHNHLFARFAGCTPKFWSQSRRLTVGLIKLQLGSLCTLSNTSKLTVQ